MAINLIRLIDLVTKFKVSIRSIEARVRKFSNEDDLRRNYDQSKLVHCQAAIDPAGCSSPPIDHWYTPFCEKHAKQERSLYYFYKHVEALWCGLDDVYDLKDVHTKYTALSYLAVVIASREAHRDWFFPGQNCPFHIGHERKQLISERERIVDTLFFMNYGIFTKTSDISIRNLLKTKLPNMRIDQPLHLMNRNPRITREEFVSIKQTAIQSLWDCLEGVQVIELLDRSQATSIQLQDHRFQHQDSVLFAPQPAEVDWDAVRQEWE
ncbi:hypothetical protein PGQ11_006297 [Apiospora arundinis]|uniref:Uncharacterized protein n=1 Tax=Apiospora arundinis TaxID=335852 RepID=A0ABR2ISA6_9PEZI